jgi:hypothetical protein
MDWPTFQKLFPNAQTQKQENKDPLDWTIIFIDENTNQELDRQILKMELGAVFIPPICYLTKDSVYNLSHSKVERMNRTWILWYSIDRGGVDE